MKTLAGLLLATLVGLSTARADIPTLITGGFEAFKASGAKGALTVWLRGSQMATVDGRSLGLPPDLWETSGSPAPWGPMEAYDVLGTYSPTPRLRRVYAVAYFEEGPVFCCFDLYKASGSWTMYGLRFSTKADEFTPVELIEKTG